jgi:hypothetical protein
MTVRVRQLIKEIEALSADERKELDASLHSGPVNEASPTYLSREAARPMIQEMLKEHSELFRKLAE